MFDTAIPLEDQNPIPQSGNASEGAGAVPDVIRFFPQKMKAPSCVAT